MILNDKTEQLVLHLGTESERVLSDNKCRSN